MKPRIREKNPDNLIPHVGTNELNSLLRLERIAKSIMEVAKNAQSDSGIFIASKLLSMYKNIEGFFVEINLRKKKKWLTSCSYNPTKIQISNHLAELRKSTDLYLTKYDKLLFLEDFNARVEDLTCFQNPEKPF